MPAAVHPLRPRFYRATELLALAVLWVALDASAQPSDAPSAEPPGEESAPAADSAPEGAPAESPASGEATGEPAPDPDAPEVAADALLRAKTAGVEEIVITGVKLEDTLQGEPVSATTFGEEEIKSLRIDNIRDLAQHTANLEINTKSAASNPTIFIRGIGLKDYNANAAGAVAIYQDDININAPAIQLFQLFDVSSVQVLRGPQGAVNGRGATAGAILVNSNLPEDELDFGGSFTYGNYNDIEAEGAASVPIVPGLLSSRVAFTANFRDGITENNCAKWNPEAHPEFQPSLGSGGLIDSYLVSKETVLEEYQKDVAANNLPNVQRYGITQTGRNNRQNRLNAAGIDAQAKRLLLDSTCINLEPGHVITPAGQAAGLGDAGTYVDSVLAPDLGDFQGLKPYTNNVENWAARGILRLQPPQEDRLSRLAGVDWILNVHGGQNLGDSRHLQMIGADAKTQGGFFAGLEQGIWSEANAAQNTHLALEGVERVPGVDDTPSLGALRGSDPFKGWYNLDGEEILNAYGANLKGLWEPGDGISVTSLTGYEWYQREIGDEGDANPFNSFPASWNDTSFQVSQELKAKGEHDRLRWTAGLFFLHEQLDSLNLFPTARGSFRIEQTFDQALWSGAPYLGASYQLTDELSFASGFRYVVESKSFSLGTEAVGIISGVGNPLIEPQSSSKTWTAPTGEAVLNWEPTGALLESLRNDTLLLYLKYSRAMKGGHFNAGLTIAGSTVQPTIEPVEPEFIHAVEVGAKTSWFDERLTLNVAGFRYWYQDLQVFTIANEAGELPLQKLFNSDAQVLGAELDFRANPLPGLSVQGSFGYLDTSFLDFTVTKCVERGSRGECFPFTFDYGGNPLLSAPEFSLAAIVEYDIPLFGWGFLRPQYDFSWRSKLWLDPQKLDPISQPAYWLHNLRLAYRTPDERIEVAGWVENLTDERYKIDVFDLSRDYNSILEVWADPRTYGITLSYAW